MLARCTRKVEHIAVQRRGRVNRCDLGASGIKERAIHARESADERCGQLAAAVAFQYLDLRAAFGIIHVDAQHEAVQLRLGQRIGALELARILRREHHEIAGQSKHRALDAHLPLFHRLKECSLRLGACAIDLIDQHDIGKERPGTKDEAALARIEDMHPDDVARHEVRRPLDAFKFTTQDVRQRLREQSLAQARHALHENVAARDERDDKRAYRTLRADDDAAEFAGEFGVELLDARAHAICLSIRRMRL